MASIFEVIMTYKIYYYGGWNERDSLESAFRCAKTYVTTLFERKGILEECFAYIVSLDDGKKWFCYLSENERFYIVDL